MAVARPAPPTAQTQPQPPPQPPPQPQIQPQKLDESNGQATALLAVLKAEAAARDAGSDGELAVLAANDLLQMSKARQVFVLRPHGKNFKVAAVSSLSTFDPNAPLVQALERLIVVCHASSALDKVQEIIVATSDSDPALAGYPFRSVLWFPMLSRKQRLLGGILIARELPWNPAERVVPERLVSCYAHALQTFAPERRWHPVWLSGARLALGAAVGAAALMLIPVPMTTLAPFETGSSQSFVVAAPSDGVIDSIEVEPNASVKAGDLIVQLNDITFRNRLEIAEHEVAVAQARMTQSMQLAFDDMRGRHEIGIARADHALKVAERDYAREMLEKTKIRAPRDGLAIFSDKQSLLGHPVATGERIMEVADPNFAELRIDVPVSDAISVRNSSFLKAFFDADPLHARSGKVVHADYQARQLAGDVLAYRVVAKLDNEAAQRTRLGSRGTAQLYGESVALAYFLFRRPLTALRQRFGL